VVPRASDPVYELGRPPRRRAAETAADYLRGADSGRRTL
jgi:hypothetical protein